MIKDMKVEARYEKEGKRFTDKCPALFNDWINYKNLALVHS